MIHQVPLKSLPNEWLWCETWCDDASKAKAKTIDLVSEHRARGKVASFAGVLSVGLPDTKNACKGG